MTTKSQRPIGLKLLAALVPMALLLALAINTGSARAAIGHDYCGTVIAPGGICTDNGFRTNLQGNVALFPGEKTTLTVCQEVFSHNLGRIISSTCGINGTGSASNVSSFLGQTLTPYVKNGSTVNPHTVRGIWFSP